MLTSSTTSVLPESRWYTHLLSEPLSKPCVASWQENRWTQGINLLGRFYVFLANYIKRQIPPRLDGRSAVMSPVQSSRAEVDFGFLLLLPGFEPMSFLSLVCQLQRFIACTERSVVSSVRKLDFHPGLVLVCMDWHTYISSFTSTQFSVILGHSKSSLNC